MRRVYIRTPRGYLAVGWICPFCKKFIPDLALPKTAKEEMKK